MFSSLFDVAALSDKELQDKISDMTARLSAANAMGMSPGVIDTIQDTIGTCYEELYSRRELKTLSSLKAEPVIFDLDSYRFKKEEKNESTGKQNYRPGW